MKIKKLTMDNFVNFKEFEIEFNGKITNLVGINGSGKTTVGLTAIWACLKGISQKNTNDQLIGEKYRFIGNDKATADIELTLLDEEKNAEIKIKNRISKTSNNITFDAPDGYKIDSDWVKNLFSVAFLSAKNFTQRSSKEQAILLGIDTKRFDEHIADLKKDYTYINRKITSAGELRAVDKVEQVSISELLKEKDKIDAFNACQLSTEQSQKYDKGTVESHREEINKLQQLIVDYTDEITDRNNLIISINHNIKNRKIEDRKDTSEIIGKINNAEETNQKANEYQTYAEKKAARDAAKSELDSNDRNQKNVMKERLEYIKSFDFGFEELSVGEDGGLLLSGRPIKDQYFSKGQLEVIVARLHEKKNPGLKVRFIDNLEILDEKNQKSIIDGLLEAGFQVITAQVGDECKKENSVLLRECKKVGD